MILDGKKISLKIQAEIKSKIESLNGPKPGLAVILIGNNPASALYVKMKRKACEDVGINSFFIHLDETIEEKILINEIEKLNNNELVNGILVQFPLPKHIDSTKIVDAIAPHKDVDCFHPYNMGKLALGQPDFIPCTPKGIQLLLEEYQIDVASKNVVILGRSNLVGKPLALLLMQKNANASVTVLHSKSKNIKETCQNADILIAALGVPHFLKEDFVKNNAVVIDVGINRIDNKVIGDVDYDNVAPKCGYITPVPGGVGPMTIAALLTNTFHSFTKSLK